MIRAIKWWLQCKRIFFFEPHNLPGSSPSISINCKDRGKKFGPKFLYIKVPRSVDPDNHFCRQKRTLVLHKYCHTSMKSLDICTTFFSERQCSILYFWVLKLLGLECSKKYLSAFTKKKKLLKKSWNKNEKNSIFIMWL